MAPSFVRFERDGVEQSIPQRFEAQVHRDPGRLAVATREHAWSYGALNRAANRVARAIVAERGTDPEPVALLVTGQSRVRLGRVPRQALGVRQPGAVTGQALIFPWL